MEFTQTDQGLRLAAERHYTLVPVDGLTDNDLQKYRDMTDISLDH